MAQPDFSLGSSSTLVAEVLPMILSRDSQMVERFSTDISIGRSGKEKRVGGWSVPQAMFDLGPGVRTLKTLRLLRKFWRNVYGPRDAWLFHHFLYHTTADVANLKDRRPGPITMTDETLGTGDGINTDFQLIAFSDGAPEYIIKPKADVVAPKIAVDGVLQDPSVSPPDYTLDTDPETADGIVKFTTPPGIGQTVTAGFEYYIVCRFEGDDLDMDFQNYDRGIATVRVQQIWDFN